MYCNLTVGVSETNEFLIKTTYVVCVLLYVSFAQGQLLSIDLFLKKINEYFGLI